MYLDNTMSNSSHDIKALTHCIIIDLQEKSGFPNKANCLGLQNHTCQEAVSQVYFNDTIWFI